MATRRRFTTGEPESLSATLGGLLDGPLGKGLSTAAKAARGWYAANGDRERAHTTGVWLQKARAKGADPVLVVAVDSNLLAADLGTNKDLYLSRLAFHGVAVSDIRFTVHRPDERDRGRGTFDTSGAGADKPAELPALSPAEEARVERATQRLDGPLKQSVSKAMSASLRRSKASHTHPA